MGKKSKTVRNLLLLAAGASAAAFIGDWRSVHREGVNPYSRFILDRRMQDSLGTLKRLNDAGTLYYMDYAADYYSSGIYSLPIRFVGSFGCSAFVSANMRGDIITGRNYDLPHKDREGNITGLNIAFTLKPEGKYRSVNMADASWLSYLKMPFFSGALDNGRTNLTPLMFIPFLTMDGMNEKGLTVSILALDIKSGETAVSMNAEGKKKTTLNELTRFMIDSCATVEEAAELAGSCNVTSILGFDYHLFVSDASGASAVFEWRHNEFTVTYQDACTNFYVNSDDAEDCYKDGVLKEKFEQPKEKTGRYRYGFGHGYGRFAKLAEALEDHRVPGREGYGTQMEDFEARDLLSAVAQDYTGGPTSFTQYSVLYNQTRLTAGVWVQQDYGKVHFFEVPFAE